MEGEGQAVEAAQAEEDVQLPVVDPMLEPVGGEAEEEMRRKLKRRLKELRRTKKAEKKEKREKRREKEEAEGFANVVKIKKRKKHKEKSPEPEADGYRYDRHESNHRVKADEVMDPRFFPYKEVFYNDRYEEPRRGDSGDERDAGGRGLSSRVAAVATGARGRGSEAERWGHDGYQQRDRSPPPLPPEYYRGQKPGQRKGLGSYEPRQHSDSGPSQRDDRHRQHSEGRRDERGEAGDWRERTDQFGRVASWQNRYAGGTRKAFPRSPSPPRRTREATPPALAKSSMPAHLKWLHDRWSKYDSAFFQPSKKAATVPDPLASPAQEAAHKRELAEIQKERTRRPRKSRKDGKAAAEEEDKFAHLPASSRNHMPFYVREEIRFGRMKNFKEFLLGHHEDCQSQERATQLYNEYKLQFRQRAFAEFFQLHSEDEWFLERYHPVVKAARDSRRREGVKHRLDVFMQLLVRGWMEVCLDHKASRRCRRLMDAAIVLMEGGDEGDIACLSDLDYDLEEKKEETYEVQGIKSVPEVEASDSEEEEAQSAVGKAPGQCLGEDERAEAPSDEALEVAQAAKDYSHYIQKRVKASVELEDLVDEVGEACLRLERRTEYLGSGVFVQQVVDPKRLEEMNLQKISAIMVRNIPPTVPRAEVESLVGDTHGATSACTSPRPTRPTATSAPPSPPSGTTPTCRRSSGRSAASTSAASPSSSSSTGSSSARSPGWTAWPATRASCCATSSSASPWWSTWTSACSSGASRRPRPRLASGSRSTRPPSRTQ
jgi:hypothetical protein